MNTNQVQSNYRSVIAPLSAVMDYRHPSLVARLEKKLRITGEDAQVLFDDTKRFLYLCAHNRGQMAPSERIDEGWHHFLLFTQDYHAFCHHFFGRFIHHRPRYLDDPSPDGTAIFRTLEAARTVFGTLSSNWEYLKAATDCEECSPTTNCQDADCHDS